MDRGAFYWVFLIFVLISCGKRQDYLENALRLAGKNRPELEKVLAHYRQHPADSLKYRAAVFLIENMDTRFSFDSPELDIYYKRLDSISSLNERYEPATAEQEALLNQLKKPDPVNFKTVPDLQQVSCEFLIDNIDRAFDDWQSPHAKELSFADFCEYLLPCKSERTEHPDFWRSTFKDAFSPYIRSGTDISCNPDSGIILNYPSLVLDGKTYIPVPVNFNTIPEFSVSCRVNPSEYKKRARVFDFGTDSSRFVRFTPYDYDYNGAALFQAVTMPYLWDDAPRSNPLPLNRYSSIAMTYSKNIISFYIDGILQKRTRTRLTGKDLINNYIGKSQYASDAGIYFKGDSLYHVVCAMVFVQFIHRNVNHNKTLPHFRTQKCPVQTVLTAQGT